MAEEQEKNCPSCKLPKESCICGGPTKFTEETITQAKQYLADWMSGKLEDEVIPTIEGLASYLRIGRNTVYRWKGTEIKAIKKEERQEFNDIVEWLETEQAKALLNGGLMGKLNSTIAKLILGKHGYKDQQDLTSDNKPIPLTNYVRNNDSDQQDTGTEQED